MKKKPIIFYLFLVASLVSACGGKKPGYQEMVTVKMAISAAPQISYAPIFIAEKDGYFVEYGLKIEHIAFNSASEAVTLLVSGDADVYAGTLNAGFLNTVYSDDNIKAVADRGHITPGGCTYQAILIRKDLLESGAVTGPSDLAGLTFSTSTAGPAAYLLSTYLAQGGLTFNDIEIKNLDVPSEIEAYATKAIAGGVAPEPSLTRILDAGNAAILAKAENVLGTFQSGIIAFGTKLLVENPDVGARFLAAYLKGVEQFNKGKTEHNLQIIAEASGETVENLKAVCWVGINNDGTIDFASVDKFQKWSIVQKQLDNPVTESQFWDPRPLRAAQALLNP